MKKTIEFAWEALREECKRFQSEDSAIKFHEERFEEFDGLFRKKYDDIMDRFMRDTTELDSHKQAAIITISALEAQAITHETESGAISIVPQLVALSVGLSYMNDRLNEVLAKKHIERIDKYMLPIATACDTPYIEIMSRLLYYEQNEQDMAFNVLELSDRYFLLEYINLLQHGIEPVMLKGR